MNNYKKTLHTLYIGKFIIINCIVETISQKCLKSRKVCQETVKIFILNTINNLNLIHQLILIEKSKVILMDKITLLDPPIPSKDYKCIGKKCLIKLKCIKDQLKPPESIPIENGSVMSELSIKKHSKSWEFKWPKSNKILLKFLSNLKKYLLLFFKILPNKTKSDYSKLKHINKHLVHNVVEKK